MTSLIDALFKYLLGTDFVPGTVLGRGEFDVKPKEPDLQGLIISWGP